MKSAGDTVLPSFQKKHVIGSIGQGQVKVAGDFDEGEVLAPVDGEGEDGRVAGGDGGGSISLMDIGIHDRDLLDYSLCLERTGGDDGIVEDAEAFGPVRESMMSTAGQMDADAIAKSRAGGLQGGAGRMFASRDEFSGPG